MFLAIFWSLVCWIALILHFMNDFRYNVVKIAVARHKRRIDKWKKGDGMFEDPTEEVERTEAAKKKRRWYKSDKKYDSVMFVQPTANSQLKKNIQRIARRNGLKIK